MTCRKIRKQLIPWLDGELQPDKAKEIQAWFDSCAQVRQCSVCRKLIAEYRSFQNAFQNTPQTGFPAYLHHRIMDSVKQREPIRHRHEIRTRWEAIPATIAILISLYAGSLIGIKTFTSQSGAVNENSELYSFGENGTVSTFYTAGDTE
jgi:hypothetical protein